MNRNWWNLATIVLAATALMVVCASKANADIVYTTGLLMEMDANSPGGSSNSTWALDGNGTYTSGTGSGGLLTTNGSIALPSYNTSNPSNNYYTFATNSTGANNANGNTAAGFTQTAYSSLYFSSSTAYTLEAWVRPGGASGQLGLISPTQTYGALIADQNASVVGYLLALTGPSGNATPSSVGITFQAARGGGSTLQAVSATSSVVAMNQWSQVVATFDGSTGMALYVNGVLVSSTPSGSSGISSVPAAGSNSFQLGARDFGAGTNDGPLYYAGDDAIDRVYSGALTAGQVQQNFNADAARFGLSPLPEPSLAVLPAAAMLLTALRRRRTRQANA